MKELLRQALDAATAAGATYADARGVEALGEALAVRGPTVESLDRTESIGFGVRVLADGAWGFASSALLDRAEAQRLGKTAVEVAKASATAISRPVELVPEPAHTAEWSSQVGK